MLVILTSSRGTQKTSNKQQTQKAKEKKENKNMANLTMKKVGTAALVVMIAVICALVPQFTAHGFNFSAIVETGTFSFA